MFIKRVEIFGFKSFKNKTVLEFENREITGIVGPNGCGKSNVLDALLWVMGENSPRHLRGESLSDIIFSGAKGADPRPFAEVSLILGQGDNSFPGDFKDFSELMICRKVWRDGKSECFINSRACLLKDIRELFMNTGAGCRGFSIIEQESIEKLISAKPPQRRFIVEEAAGLSKFKSRKAESERKLKLVRQNLKRLDDILSLQENQLSRLTAQAKAAEKYRKLKKERERLNELIGAREKEELFARFHRLEKEQKLLEAQKEGETAALKDLETHLSEAKSHLQNLRQKESRFQMEEASLKSKIKLLHLTAGFEEKKQALEKQEAEVCAQLEALGDFFKEKGPADLLRQKSARLKEQNAEREKALREREISLSACVMERQVLEKQTAAFLEEKKRVQAQIQSLVREKKKARSLLKKRDQLSLHFEKESQNIQQSEKNLAKKLAHIEKNLNEGRQKLSALEYKTHELENLARRFESLNETARDLRKKQPENFCSLFDSLEVEPDSALAVDSALGSYIQSLVPLRDGVLEQAVEKLKSENKGKVYFLNSGGQQEGLLPSVRKDLEQSPGFSGFLSEKVKWNVYNSALKPLLSRTVLVSDFQTALQLKKRFPKLGFVTKEGDLLRDSFVCAGSAQEDTGWLNIRAGIQEHQREIKSQRIELKAAELARDSEKEKLSRLRKTQQKAEAKKKDNEQSALSFRQDIKRMEAKLLNLTESRAKSNENIKTLNEEREELILREKAERKEAVLAGKAIEQGQAEETAFEKELSSYEERLLTRDKYESELDLLRQNMRNLDEETALLLRMADLQAEDGDPQREKPHSQEEESHPAGFWLKKAEELSARLDAFKKDRPALLKMKEAGEKQLKNLEDRFIKQKILPAQRKSEMEKKDLEKNWLKQSFLEKYRSSLKDFEPKGEARGSAPLDRLKEERAYCEKRLDKIKAVNFLALEEYEKLFEENAFLSRQRTDLDRSQKELSRLISHIDKICDKRFNEMLDALNRRFSKVFPVLFQGREGEGSARLVLHEDAEGGESGLDIIVRPPGKKAKSVSLLSRGEKALTSLCLIYSLFLVRPAPFCIIDEADGPLDDANVFRFISVLREMAARSQIIVITHNKYSMQSCQKLYGVTMGEPGVSQVVSVDMKSGRGGQPSDLMSIGSTD